MDFLDALAPLVGYGTGPIAVAAGVLARASLLAFLLPGLGERTVSMRIRLTVALVLTVMTTPLITDGRPAPETSFSLAAFIAAEAASGAVLGFAIRIALFILQTAGSIAAQHISLAQLFGGSMGEQPEPPIGNLFMVAGIALALAAGLHFKAFEAFVVSYEIMPLGVFPGGASMAEWAAERAAFAFSAALSLAMPFVVLGVMYYLAIGAANRAMPQLMVAFVGAPAITLAGLTMTALATPVLLGAWMGIVDGIFASLTGMSR